MTLILAVVPVTAQQPSTPPPPPAITIPTNISTQNVPALPQLLAQRLQRYAHTRRAVLRGWQGDALLVSTRFAETEQLHRVSQPLGYRQQITYLPEPLAALTVPRGGASNNAILSWDVGGSEFKQLFLFDLRSGESRLVSDGHSLYDDVIWAADEQSFVYVTTQRNGRNWDIHQQHLDGRITEVLQTDEGYWYPIDWSMDMRYLLVKNRVSINESSIHQLDLSNGQLQPLLGVAEQMAIGAARYDGRGGVYFTSDHGSEFLQLRHLNLSNGEHQVVGQDRGWNVEGFALSPAFDKLAYSVNVAGLSQLRLLSLPDHKVIPSPPLPAGIVLSLMFAGDSNKLGLTLVSATSPADVHVLDIAAGVLQRWTRSEVGGLNADHFVDAQLINYPSFDGRDIPAFVYQPPTPAPHAVVVMIHGGPEAQYRPYFSTTVQSYVREMNVAVIAPNVRGSNGYGKSYLQLDNGMKREDSVRDIGALLDWIETQPQFASNKVAVMGGSYGGYMVLASMVHYGERLAAAVESVGISNFVTFLQNTQSYRQDLRRVEYGDERQPQMRAFLQQISPLNHVHKMVTPVLISQGANDPRVPASESEQMRAALAARGVPVWYILASDEGHGFRKKANRDYDRVAKFAFLEAYLKQTTEPADQ